LDNVIATDFVDHAGFPGQRLGRDGFKDCIQMRPLVFPGSSQGRVYVDAVDRSLNQRRRDLAFGESKMEKMSKRRGWWILLD
jgi:hypothetical protein